MLRWLCVGSVVRMNMCGLELARAIPSPSPSPSPSGEGEGEGEGEGPLSVLSFRFEPLPLSIFHTANRHFCRGSLPLHPDFSEFHLTSLDFTFSSHKPIFPSQIPRIFLPTA